MRYKKVTVSYEPAITGNSKGGYSVEIKDRLSFNSPTEKKYFESFFKKMMKTIIEFLSKVLKLLIQFI